MPPYDHSTVLTQLVTPSYRADRTILPPAT